MNERLAPRSLILIQSAEKEVIEKKIVDSRILVEGFLDFSQKSAANDASAAPHQCDTAHVQIPAVLFGGSSQQHVSLRVRDDLGAIKGAAHILNERDAVALDNFSDWTFKDG